MAGWFDGLFQGAAEIENRLARGSAAGKEEPPEPLSDYAAGFRQGVLDARAVAAFRSAESARRRPAAGATSGFDRSDPRT
jgi:hypothetical protein